ncbi:MAG: DUF541 domain-containing protein [Clostridiales bacterium]|nr:DUF541 domain-containing protein [Clostridiales bacterium]
MNRMKNLLCKPLILSLIVALLLSLSLPAFADEDRTVTVEGSASVSLKADMATIEIGVETKHADVAAAQSENTRVMNAVIAALQACGISEDDLITSNFNVYTVYDYSYSSVGAEERIMNYTVSNMLSVTVRDLTVIGQVLDVAVEAGANQIYGLNFTSTESNAAYQKALMRAVEDAQEKAQVLCTASQVELGKLLHIDAQETGYVYGARNTFTMDAASAKGAAIVSGDVQVGATVTLTYEIK